LNLNPQTMFVGQSVIYVLELDSTNAYLKHFLKTEEAVEGIVVVTEFQTHGKGQQNNSWSSDKNKNALFSILLKPKNLKAEELCTLAFLVSLSIRAAVQKHIPKAEVKVKWPNDVMVGNQKVAGILIENKLNKSVESIIGVGLNVNQVEFDNLPNATSLKKVTKSAFDLGAVISDCLYYVEKYYLLTKRAEGLKQIWKLYVTQLYKLNEVIQVDGLLYSISGVDCTGKLQISNELGNRTLQHKEAHIIWN
jgi:BirA family biotin operon repressor/biotin-[acetyl-CoA-carboxylase] ligase